MPTRLQNPMPAIERGPRWGIAVGQQDSVSAATCRPDAMPPRRRLAYVSNRREGREHRVRTWPPRRSVASSCSHDPPGVVAEPGGAYVLPTCFRGTGTGRCPALPRGWSWFDDAAEVFESPGCFECFVDLVQRVTQGADRTSVEQADLQQPRQTYLAVGAKKSVSSRANGAPNSASKAAFVPRCL